MIKPTIRLLRPKHWIKNLFVLAPLVFSGAFVDLDSVIEAVLATLMFCLAASATYIINDIRDIEYDKQHPKKSRSRPLATGEIRKTTAYGILAILWFGFSIYSYLLFPPVLLVLMAYVLLMIAYTYVLKHQPIIDIFTIALGFVLRIYAGAVAISVPVSPWMFVTTFTLALYLAAIKRRQELRLTGEETRKVLKHYTESLVSRYAEMSATGALVFYSLFVLSERPQLIVTIPIVLFGLFRYWFVVESYESGESPTEVFYKDAQLMLSVLVWISITVYVLWPA